MKSHIKNKKKLILIGLGIIALIVAYPFVSPFFLKSPGWVDTKVVEVDPVKIQDIHTSIRLIGTIRAKYSTILTAKAAGSLDQLVEPGTKVAKGTLLATIDTGDFEKGRIAKDQYERAVRLHKAGHLSKQGLETKRTSLLEVQKEQATVQFVAPFKGVLGVYKVREGAHVKDGDAIARFYDPDSLVVEFDIPESSIPFVADGQNVTIAGKPFAVTHVQKMIDEDTHMSPAYVDYTCDACVIGSPVDVELTLQHKEQVVVISREALFLKQGKTFVYIVKDNKAKLTPVTLGLVAQDKIEIKSGLKVGDSLVAQGHTRLYPEVAVKIAEAKTAEKP
jgi:membrane fusion protein (multidrug efflux system)